MEAVSVTEKKPEVKLDMSTSKYKVIDIDAVINGEYSAADNNFAINGVIPRVVMPRCDIDALLNKTAPAASTEDSKIKGTKRKLAEITVEETPSTPEDSNKSNLEPKMKRGRPRKITPTTSDEVVVVCESDTEVGEVKEIRKRGRPRKSVTDAKAQPIVKAASTPVTELKQANKLNTSTKKQKFNGSSSANVDTRLTLTPRIRKPNSRLQDFVVSTAVRYYAQTPTSTPVKVESVAKEKVVKKLSKSVVADDPLLIPNNSSKTVYKNTKKINKSVVEDPLQIPSNAEDVKKDRTHDDVKATQNGDDVVRSFLPVFDQSPRSSNKDETAGHSSKSRKIVKEKENQVNNLQNKVSRSSMPKLKPLKAELADYSPPKLRSAADVKVKASTPKSQKSATKPETSSSQQKKASQTSTFNNEVPKKQKLKEVEKSVTDKPNKATNNTPKSKMNGSNSGIKQSKSNMKYILVDSDNVRNKNKSPKVGDVDFNKLVRSLKLVKLPAANWKIRIVVSKQQTITEVTFTNKDVNERCIKFSRTFTGYIITFGKDVVNLLGAPSKITSFNDVSILLDIVHHISTNDPVLEYGTSSNV